MKYLKLFEASSLNNQEIINEDYLELKSIGKQLYSFLKKKGYNVTIKENSSKSKYRGGDELAGSKNTAHKGGPVEIHQFSDEESVGVFVPVHALVYQFITNPDNLKYVESLAGKSGLDDLEDNWTHIMNNMWGKHGKIAQFSDIKEDTEIKKYVSKLGEELKSLVDSKYPNMEFAFEDSTTHFGMYFREPKTSKGGVANPKQRPNAKPKEVAEVAESKVIKTFELFTSTYQSAANKAQQKGLSGLADRFTRHGRQFGIRDKSSEITLYIEDKATKFETYYLGKVEIWDYEFKIELTNVDTDKTDWLYGISNETNGVETYKLHLNQDYDTLAATRKDAKLLVDFLKENGFNYGVSDIRTLVKGYA